MARHYYRPFEGGVLVIISVVSIPSPELRAALYAALSPRLTQSTLFLAARRLSCYKQAGGCIASLVAEFWSERADKKSRYFKMALLGSAGGRCSGL